MNESPEKDQRHRERMERKKAVVDEKIAQARDERGVLLVHSGNGKGKGQDIGFRRDAIQDALEAMVDDGAVGVVAGVFAQGAGRNPIERRQGHEDPALTDRLGHDPIEEGDEQRRDVGAVHVRVGHDDDAVVAQLVGVEVIAPRAAADADMLDGLCGSLRFGPLTRRRLLAAAGLETAFPSTHESA